MKGDRSVGYDSRGGAECDDLDARAEQYALVNVEADRITNSLNTLGEQVTEWVKAEKH